MGEYMRAHGAKSTKFVRAEGCEHAADAVITKKGIIPNLWFAPST